MTNLKMASLCALVFLVLAANLVAGQRGREQLPTRWNVNKFPDPRSLITEEQRRCGRFNVSSVCDPNGIITRTSADAIDNVINQIYTQTQYQCPTYVSNGHGYIVRVALMPEFERVLPNSENTTFGLLRDAQMYSYMLSQRWGMEGSCNETVLILYARDNGLLYTLTRQGSRIRLSNDDVKRISLMVRRHFDTRETIADGLLEMLHRYKLVFEGRHNEALQSNLSGSTRG